MTATYDHYMFVPPPRPELAVPRGRLRFYRGKPFVCQAKLNGTYNEIAVSPQRELIAKKRTGEDHIRWSFSEQSSKLLRNLRGKGWFVFCAELINTKGYKDINYFHDILVADGKLLVGKTYTERMDILCQVLPPAQAASANLPWGVIDDHNWIGWCHLVGFEGLYDTWGHIDIVEGVVLKDTTVPYSLAHPGRGQIKCRKATKNYGF